MGLLKKIFGSNDDSRKSKNGTKFTPATKGRVIIQKPGYKPAVGHSKDSSGYKKGKSK